MQKLRDWIESYKNATIHNKIILAGLMVVSAIMFLLLVYFLHTYLGVILVFLATILILYSDEISTYINMKTNSADTCIDSCIGCDAVYPAVLTTVYDALKTVSPVLHISVPPTERQTQTICPPRPDGLPRCAFRVMKRNEGDPISDEDILSCFRQTLQDSFASHGSSFLCTGVQDLYVEEVKQDDYAITFTIMPYCPSRTASCINQLKRREQIQKDRLAAKQEEHIYDDQL